MRYFFASSRVGDFKGSGIFVSGIIIGLGTGISFYGVGVGFVSIGAGTLLISASNPS